MRLPSFVLFAVAALAVVLCTLAADEPKRTPSADDFATLFQQLSDDNSERREAAFKTLKTKGVEAVAPALNAALDEPLESGIRAVMLLEELDGGLDDKASLAAENALKRLAAEGAPGVASRAQEALNRHIVHRTVRAAKVIREFKGQIGSMPQSSQRFILEEDEDSLPTYGLVDRNWKGGAAGLQQFGRADSVRTLYLLKGHPLTAEELAEFHKQYPRIAIVERGAAFVGVGTGSHRFGCMIGTAVDGKPGDRAGLRPGDIVVRIGDYEIQSADDLIKTVAEYQPGDVVRFVYLRDEYRYQWLYQEWERDPTELGLLTPNLLLQSMRRETEVTMGAWELIPWNQK